MDAAGVEWCRKLEDFDSRMQLKATRKYMKMSITVKYLQNISCILPSEVELKIN